MKLGNVLSFAEIYNLVKDQKMPLRVAYKFSKLASRMDTETEFYKTKLQEIVDEYVEKDERGAPVMVDNGMAMKIIPGKEEACSAAMNELQNLEIDIEPVFTVDELDGLELTPTQIQNLMPLIIE